MTTLTGSAVLALAVARGFLSAEAAWQAAHVDEDFQAERWGEDTEAVARRGARWREFEAAGGRGRSRPRALTRGLREPVSSRVYPEQPR